MSTITLDKTTAGISAWILRSLGGGVVAVELTADQVTDAIEAACVWFMAYAGQIKYGTIALTAAQEYDVEEDTDAVMEVFYPDTGTLDDSAINTSAYANVPLEVGRGAYGMTDITITLQYLEQSRRVIGNDPEWEFDAVRRKLVISPSPGSGVAAYLYASNALDLGKIRNTDFLMIRDRSMAEAKHRLGMIRTKYGEVPSADGSFNMNGDTLLAEAADEKRLLDEKILNLVQPFPIIVG